MRKAAIPTLLVVLSNVAVAQTPEPHHLDWNAITSETQQILQDYLRINTTNPPGNEMKAAVFLKGILEKEGFEVQLLDSTELGPGE